MKPQPPRWTTALLSMLLLTTNGCSYVYDLTLTGELLRGPNRLPVVGATVTLFTAKMDHCSTTTDSQGRWSLTTSLRDGEFWPDGNGRLWLRTDPPYPSDAPKADFPYTIRVETDEGTIECPIPRISTPKGASNLSASMSILLDATFTHRPRNADTNPE